MCIRDREWDHASILDWDLLNQMEHHGIQALIRDLNCLYRVTPGLHGCEFAQEGFEWLDCHDATHSIMAYLRRGDDNKPVVVVFNFAAVARLGYRVGVPNPGNYCQLLNSDYWLSLIHI